MRINTAARQQFWRSATREYRRRRAIGEFVAGALLLGAIVGLVWLFAQNV